MMAQKTKRQLKRLCDEALVRDGLFRVGGTCQAGCCEQLDHTQVKYPDKQQQFGT